MPSSIQESNRLLEEERVAAGPLGQGAPDPGRQLGPGHPGAQVLADLVVAEGAHDQLGGEAARHQLGDGRVYGMVAGGRVGRAERGDDQQPCGLAAAGERREERQR